MKIKVFVGCSLLATVLQVAWFIDPVPLGGELPKAEEKPAVVQKAEAAPQPDKEPETKEVLKPAHTIIEGSGTYYGGLEQETN